MKTRRGRARHSDGRRLGRTCARQKMGGDSQTNYAGFPVRPANSGGHGRTERVRASIVSLNGRSAYDCMSRAAFLAKSPNWQRTSGKPTELSQSAASWFLGRRSAMQNSSLLGGSSTCRRNVSCWTSSPCAWPAMSLALARHVHISASQPRVAHGACTTSDRVCPLSRPQAVWETLLACIGGGPPTIPDHANELTRSLASLPAALMGLGLTSAKRSAPVASWAAWADALPVLHTRQPVFAAVCAEAFADPQDGASGL